jgi:Fe-S-cluster containining protein
VHRRSAGMSALETGELPAQVWWQPALTTMENPCLHCGACCAAFRVSFYWAEFGDAETDSVPEEMTCQVGALLCAMMGTDQRHPRCIALHGDVGASVWCSIYERRPSVCREVVPSGHDGMPNAWCDSARAIWGLPPLGSCSDQRGDPLANLNPHTKGEEGLPAVLAWGEPAG